MTSCWIVTEGLAGTENQCLGIAEFMGIMPLVKRIGLNQPWALLSPWLGWEQSWTFTGDPLRAPWPDLVIASGRKSIAAARYIKRQSAGRTMVVQIQDPRTSASSFDLVAVPHHDRLRGSNVIVTHAAPNRITPQRLADGRADFANIFSAVPYPRVGVLIGGNSKTHRLTPEIMKTLAHQLKELDRHGYGLMITTSRRTGDENLQTLKDTLKETRAFLWDGRGSNPYFGIMGWADYILVTSDSTSMISEAATTGKPVYMIPLEGTSSKFEVFHRHMTDLGVIRPFEGRLETFDYEPLDDARLVGEEIRKRMPPAR